MLGLCHTNSSNNKVGGACTLSTSQPPAEGCTLLLSQRSLCVAATAALAVGKCV